MDDDLSRRGSRADGFRPLPRSRRGYSLEISNTRKFRINHDKVQRDTLKMSPAFYD